MTSIGLTGIVGSGKTTVLGMFKDQGARVLSADDVVHEEFRINENLKERLRRLFGPGALERGMVNRPFLAKRVFGNVKALEKLNLLIHPLVKRRITAFLKKYGNNKKIIAVVEVPLLFETGFDKLFDWTVVVTATPEILKKRSRLSIHEWRQRARRQKPLSWKVQRCDFTIDNNLDQQQTRRQVKNLLRFFTSDAHTTALVLKKSTRASKPKQS